ncbi:MAG: hypothetical protein J2P34_06405 [Actinobacteria bacterium]|nr:hypothetical protein [Actinomycetota bacterium]
MIIVVTYVAADGAILRRTVDTAGRHDARMWEELVEQAALPFPPAYRPAPGSAVYHVRAEDQAILVAEDELVGPLRELVTAVLAEGEGQ